LGVAINHCREPTSLPTSLGETAARVEERIGGHGERGDALLRNSFECRVDLGVGARPQANDARRLRYTQPYRTHPAHHASNI